MEAITQAVRHVAKEIAISYALVFGSASQGSLRPDSDIDIAAKFEGEITLFGTIARVARTLQSVPGFRPVHVIGLNDAPLLLKYEIFATGKPVYIEDEHEYFEDRVRTIIEYLDYEPFIRMHYRRIVEEVMSW